MSEDYAARMQEIQGRLVSQAELTKSHWDDAVAIKYYREHIDWYSGDCLNNFVGKIREMQEFFDTKVKEMSALTSC